MRLSILPIFLFLLGFGCSPAINSKKNSHPFSQSLKAEIERILADSMLARSRIGIKVVSLRSGMTLYEKDSGLLFHPASNMKLLTTATALARLGTNFRFKTSLFADSAAIGDSAIAGDLYLKGFGNPDLTLDDLGWLVRQIKHRGIRKIDGNLVCDESYFDDRRKGLGWMWDDTGSWSYAPFSALSVNDNCVTVYVKAGENAGDSLIVELEPATQFMAIDNQATTVDSMDTAAVQEFEIGRKWRQNENTVLVKGGLFAKTPEKQYAVDVHEPALFTGTLLSERLLSEGIDLTGTVIKGVTPDSFQTVLTHYSEPLTNAIINVNKISDNLSSELLLKTIAAAQTGRQGTSEAGLHEVRLFMSEVGIDTTQMALADGSGDSRYNLISPGHIVQLLEYMYYDFSLRPEFITSLPIAGVDGTLRHRMRGTSAYGKLRAKTGTLRGVSTLSGYTTMAQGEPVAFSIMIAHYVGSSWRMRRIQDKIGSVISALR